METLGNRIKDLRNNLGITQNDIATWLNASRQSVSNWETDKADLSGEQLAIIINHTNVNADWLLTGRGEMFGGGNVTQSIDNVSNKLGVANVSNVNNGNLDKMHELELKVANLEGELRAKNSILDSFMKNFK